MQRSRSMPIKDGNAAMNIFLIEHGNEEEKMKIARLSQLTQNETIAKRIITCLY